MKQNTTKKEVFKAKVQERGRIQIPLPNRESSGIKTDDIVEIILVKEA